MTRQLAAAAVAVVVYLPSVVAGYSMTTSSPAYSD